MQKIAHFSLSIQNLVGQCARVLQVPYQNWHLCEHVLKLTSFFPFLLLYSKIKMHTCKINFNVVCKIHHVSQRRMKSTTKKCIIAIMRRPSHNIAQQHKQSRMHFQFKNSLIAIAIVGVAANDFSSLVNAEESYQNPTSARVLKKIKKSKNSSPGSNPSYNDYSKYFEYPEDMPPPPEMWVRGFC